MKKWLRFYKDTLEAVEDVGQRIADVAVETYEVATEAVGETKHSAKQVYKDTLETVEDVGQHIVGVAAETYEYAAVAVDETKYGVKHMTDKTYGAFTDKLDEVIDVSIQRIYTMIEKRIEHLATDVYERIAEALLQRQIGLILLGFSIAFGTLSALLLSLALVYLVILFFNLPLWLGFISICMLFAITSACCFILGQRHIKVVQQDGLLHTRNVS